MLLQIIKSSSVQDEGDVIFTETIPNLQRIGDRQFVYPSVVWANGSTYMVGDKPYTAFKNQIVCIQYNHNFGWFDFTDVGNGTTTPDTYDHPVPFVRTENGYIYTGQTDPHNEPIRIYKSNVTSSIQNGFTEVDSVGDDEAYPQCFTDINGNTAFFVRDYLSTGTHHDLATLVSDGGIEGTFTKTVITYNDTTTPPTDYYRHYNCSPVIYGNPTKHYFLSSVRHDNAAEYFMHGILVTDDFDTYTNYDESYSTQISVDGRIDFTDFEAEFVFNGSTANDTTNLNPCTAIQVDDTLFVIYKDDSTEVYMISKFENGTRTDAVLDIDFLDDTQFYTPFPYWNGTSITVSCICDNSGTYTKELWDVSIALDVFTRAYTYENPVTTTRPILLPDNLDLVNGQYMAVLDQDGTDYTFLLTTDKFRL